MDAEKAKGVETPPSIDSDVSVLAEDYGLNEKSFMRKIDLKIVPGVTILYLLSFLDRSNVANAKLDGLTTSLHMTTNQYLTGLTLFFVGYISLEIVWNVILKRIGPKLWLPTVTLVWGVITVLQAVVTNLTGFLVIRTFLGIAEGGLFPGVVFYLSMWYKRSERQYRVALFFSAASLAGAFGGILAYGIGFMSGKAGLLGWNWIFIIEGIATVLISIAGYWFIVDWPDKTKFLTENERAYVHARLKADSDATNNEIFLWSDVLKCLKDPKCWLYGLAYHTLSLPLYTLSLFLPTIIAALGYKAWEAQLLTVPPYALATILTVTYAIVGEKFKRRAIFIAMSTVTAMVGYIILLTNKNPTKNPRQSYAGVFFCAAGIYPAVALTLSWPAMNVSNQTKRATANALQITVGNLGAVIGTQTYRSNMTPKYTVGHSIALAYLAANLLVTLTIWFVLRRANRKKDAIEASDSEVPGEWNGDDDRRWRFTY